MKNNPLIVDFIGKLGDIGLKTMYDLADNDVQRKSVEKTIRVTETIKEAVEKLHPDNYFVK